ncbi:hypothetical protein QZM26_30010 [Burkholderia multivorans]|nr:hypothetical protein [Burkholderia multivorans]MCA8251570.1 hypothetical protein [Burkholderia multivorans]MDN7873633.1 hypothetical protein [Burkholderia multivorans]
MAASKLIVFLGALGFSASALASSVCGFAIPDDGAVKLQLDDGCTYVVRDKKNYAHLDFLGISDSRSIHTLLGDDTYFIEEDGAHYFISEDVEDGRVTIKTLHLDPAKPVSFNGLTGYTGSGEFFVQVLPAWQNRKEGSYSLKLMCSFMAAGNDKKSFSSRLCVPETAAGKALAENYRAKLMAIKPLD